jgi:hypothetical protein
MPTTTPAAAAPTKPKMIFDFVLMIVFVLRLAIALQNRLNNRTKTRFHLLECSLKPMCKKIYTLSGAEAIWIFF